VAIDVEYIADHHARAVAKLAMQYRDKPLLAALLGVFDAQVQAIEDGLYSIKTGYVLSAAAGEQLDVLGRIVGQDRESANDTEYRLRIAARIRANLSIGAPEDLYTVFGILLPTATLAITPHYPASFVLDVVGAVDPDLVPLYAQFLQDTKAAGVGAAAIYSTTDAAHTFTLSSITDTVESSALLGLADFPITTGGLLAGTF
jgi:hypothetical protein